MGVMRDLNQYLKLRGNRWHYQRRVPTEYASVDGRGVIRKALKTQSLEVARARRDALVEADDQYWMKLSLEGDMPPDMAVGLYRAARQRAMARGFIYSPASELADVASLADIMQRLQSIPTQPEPSTVEAEAVLGLVDRPSVKISKAMEIYCDEIAVSELLGKSEEQKKSWRKVKMRALKNFIKVVGDVPMHKITREHARKYYNWWAARVAPKDGSKPLTTNSANRDLGNIRKLYREFWEYEGDENRENPFRNLNFAKQPPKDVPCFSDEFVQTRFLKPGIFQGLNAEATLIVYAMIETGCRPSELSNILPENIKLDADVPYIQIRSRADRQLKAVASSRDIPLVGCALEAFKRAPDGFPRYRNKGNHMSKAIMDALRVRGLQATPDHRLYSLRHSFEKRMLEAGLDYGLRCLLMGHKNSRPSYGDGGSMVYRRDELLKIAHPICDQFIEALPLVDNR
jgi:integrase